MSRKLKYDPNLYGEGKGGTFDARVSENAFIVSNRRIGAFIGAYCIWCGNDFEFWSNSRRLTIDLMKEAGWVRTRGRNWKCPECQKLNQSTTKG